MIDERFQQIAYMCVDDGQLDESTTNYYGITWLKCLPAEVYVLPVWRLPSWILYFRLQVHHLYLLHWNACSRKHMPSRKHCLSIMSTSWGTRTADLVAAILNSRLPVASERLGLSYVVFPVSENIVKAFESVLLTCLGLRYVYFRLSGHHLGFTTSGYIYVSPN